jgi:DNA-binding transcriptional regulator LsrR (DeoR family)
MKDFSDVEKNIKKRSMLGTGNTLLRDDETSIATRAAWLHYAGGMTQADVAKRLGLTSLKAHRLITKANQDGLVKVYIDGDVSECLLLEDALCARFGLDYCEVVPEFDSEELPLRALGIAGAQFLRREIERGDERLIGIGHGRTLAACVEYLPRMQASKTRFVSLLGGLTHKFSANPYDVIHRLAERTGSEAFVMPVPMFANTVDDRAVLLGQKGVSVVFDLARDADLLIAGIGTAQPQASLVSTGMIDRAEIDAVKRGGGVGEILGHFFDAEGKAFETGLSNRVLGLERQQLKDRRIVAVAGGTVKSSAILAVLSSRILSGLITDEVTARALTQEHPDG